jgi:hypothetical protein
MEAGQLRLNIYVHEAKGAFWAYCPEFDLAASGPTAEEAREAVIALIDDYMSQVKRLPGDHTVFGKGPEDWDEALITASLRKDRVLN